MIDEAVLDEAVRRCALLLFLARKYGPDHPSASVAAFRPLIVMYYRMAIADREAEARHDWLHTDDGEN